MFYQYTSLYRCNKTHTSVFHNKKKILESKMIKIDSSRLRKDVIIITKESGGRWRKLNSFRIPNNHIIPNKLNQKS